MFNLVRALDQHPEILIRNMNRTDQGWECEYRLDIGEDWAKLEASSLEELLHDVLFGSGVIPPPKFPPPRSGTLKDQFLF